MLQCGFQVDNHVTTILRIHTNIILIDRSIDMQLLYYYNDDTDIRVSW